MEGGTNKLLAIDGYIRRRLRVAMIHKHPSQRKGHILKTKWNNEYFARIGLIPAFWQYYSTQFGYTIEIIPRLWLLGNIRCAAGAYLL